MGVVEALARSRKYRHLCGETLRRIAAWAEARSRSEREAVERAKRMLHQITGAYRRGDAHVSMLERDLDVYPELWRITGVPRSVLDIGCGLHPLAIPKMGLPADVDYRAWEIDRRLVDRINAARPGTAERRDVLVRPPADRVDVCLLLKMLPCLERQEKGCSERLLSTIPAGHIVCSFPTRSLGGREKGMRAHYAELMARWKPRVVERPGETFYVVGPKHPG